MMVNQDLQHQHQQQHQQQQQQLMSQPSNAKSIPTYLDEFKHGFPSNGLSSISNKWWGDNSSKIEEKKSEVVNATEKAKKEQAANVAMGTEGPINITEEPSKEGDGGLSFSKGTMLLSLVRKRAAEEGRVVKRGVGRVCRPYKISDKDKVVLMKLFKSSFPTEWE